MHNSPDLDALLRECAALATQPYRTLTLDQLESLQFYYAELDYQNGVLDNSRGALVARWIRNVNSLQDYVALTGTFPRDNRRLPRDAFTPEHRRLITWVNTTIREIAFGNRCSYQVRRLHTIPGFSGTPRNEVWDTHLATYRALLSERGVVSPLSSDPIERRHAYWRARQRAHYRSGTLTEAQIEQLEATPGWTWVEG